MLNAKLKPSPDHLKIALPPAVALIYLAVRELERPYSGRKFTSDRPLVGSIGEVVAADAFGLALRPASFAGHDVKDNFGRDVQIKVTGSRSVSLYATCDLRPPNRSEDHFTLGGRSVLRW
jgi:hypothetical protein